MISDNDIYIINNNLYNKNIVNNFLISGTNKDATIKLDLNNINDLCKNNDVVYKNNIIEKEKQFGIVTYNYNFKYGKKIKIPKNLSDVKEPLRILINKTIFQEYIDNIKELIVINTKNHNIDYKNISFQELLKDFQYTIIYKKYNNNDLQNRTLPLPGKYNDAREIYQLYFNNIDNLDRKIKNLYLWYKKHLNIRNKIYNDISSTLNNLFKNDNNNSDNSNSEQKYIFQKKHPLRFSINNNIGTPMHIDTCRKLIKKSDKNNYLICENEPFIETDKFGTGFGYIETFQDPNIFNINYTICNLGAYSDNFNSNGLRISTIEYNKIGSEEGYFFRVIPNFKNETFIFNSSKYLHYKSYNKMDIYIRGDIRFISSDKYDFNKFKLYRGPRCNLEVSFCKEQDLEKLNDNKVKYSVF